MNAKRKLLLFLPFAPRSDAAHGGGRVIAQFICEMTKHYQIAILYFRSPDELPVDDSLRNRCTLVEEVPRHSIPESLPSRLLHGFRLLGALARQRPMWVADWTSKAYLDQARSIAKDFKPDLVQAEFHLMGQYLSALEDCTAPRIIVEHEPGARATIYLQNVPALVGRLAHRLDELAWNRYERSLFSHVNAIVAFTEADREALQQISGETPVIIIPPGIHIPNRPHDPLGQQPPGLLFVGNFIHPPNVEAALILARDIYPAVQKHIPDTKLFIVGDRPPEEVRRLSGENIEITGRVPDVTPYLERAALFVAPLRSGGGIRIKVMEALAAGKAVVGTRLAFEGLKIEDGKQVAIADRDGEIAKRIVDLLENPDKRKAIAGNARAWALGNLQWEKSIRSYEALYASLQ